MITKASVKERLKPIFEAAIENRSGVSFLLSPVEAEVFTREDLENFKDEIGYTAMCEKPQQL
ncbi:TPA: hypothetical protein NIB55_005875 [Pseudomonas aeruginosa]|nr:hypothetical protein [Pseudomonas aeruginosa]